MTLMPGPELKQETDQLIVAFNPIYQLWRSKQTSNYTPEKTEDFLAKDMVKIGCYMMAADNVGKALESKLLAEIIACLRSELDHMPYDYEVAAMDGSLLEQLADCRGNMPDLQSLKILKDWVSDHHGNQSVASAILKKLVSLANRLVIRDGRLTNEELSRLGALEKALQL